jgi:hypothetical protein
LLSFHEALEFREVFSFEVSVQICYAYIQHFSFSLHASPTQSSDIRSNKKFRGLVRQRTIPTERPPLVGEFNTNFSW